MMKWERLFAPHILKRGYDYYCDDAVKLVNVTDDFVDAEVEGSDDYEVTITFSNNKIRSMECSCPYALDGKHCKHMAAVLYEWESELQNVSDELKEGYDIAEMGQTGQASDVISEHEVGIEEVLATAEPSLIRSFLKKVMEEDERLFLRFCTLARVFNKKQLTDYRLQIDAIVDRYSGRDRFISYDEAGDFCTELLQILYRDVESMITVGDYQNAFQLANQIFLVTGEVDIDDSDGEISMIVDSVYRVWKQLLDKVDLEAKKRMFAWFKDQLMGNLIDYLQSDIEQIIFSEFDEKEFEQAKVDLVLEKLKKADQSDLELSYNYDIGKWAVRYLELLYQNNSPAKELEMEKIYERYSFNSEVRKFAIDRSLANKDYDKAITILDESLVLDKAYRGLVVEYSTQKKGIYLLQGNKKAYIEQLWCLILTHKPGDLEIYRELKAEYSAEDWVVERERIFTKLSNSWQIASLYQEEKLTDRLLAYVLKSSGLGSLQQFEKDLATNYPKQVLAKYKEELEKLAYHTSNRKQYTYYVAVLRHMRKISGGPIVVRELVEKWQVIYKNRPAMMAELSKLRV